MNKRIAGRVMLLAGFLDEAIVQAQNVSFVRQLIPSWGDKVFNHYVAIPVMALEIITLWVRKERTEDETAPTSAGQQATASVRSSGNVTQTAGDLHLAVHLPSYQSPPPGPHPAPEIVPSPSLPTQPKQKNQPNLLFNGWREAIIAFNSREERWKEAEHYDRKYKAIILKVDNSPKRDHVVIATHRMSAHLRFISAGSDDLSLSPACWYQHPWGAIEMEVPSHEWLIIGARRLEPDKPPSAPIALGNRRLVAAQSSNTFFDMQIPERGVVEVQLIEGGSVLASQQYDYSLGEKYSLKRRDNALDSSEPRPNIVCTRAYDTTLNFAQIAAMPFRPESNSVEYSHVDWG